MRPRRLNGKRLAAGAGFLLLLAPWTASADSSSDAVARATVRCTAATVHYRPYAGMQPGLRVLPWVAASPSSAGLVGHLFYYGRGSVWARKRLPQLRIYSGGQTPDGSINMKILWELRHGDAMTIQLRGTRLDRAGSFAQQFSTVGHGQFPSIVNVPVPGCWSLALTAGKTTSRLVVDAVAGRHS